MNKMVNGIVVEMTQSEIAQRESEIAIAEAEFAATKYLDQRLAEYGSVAAQIEFITENGMAAWQSRVSDIKEKYPK